MTALPPQVAQLCGKIVGQLSSSNEGTVVAASRALVSTLARHGLGITDLVDHVTAGPREVVRFVEHPARAQPEPYPFGSWREAGRRASPNEAHRARVARCREAGGSRLTDWERVFLDSVGQRLRLGRSLTEAQAASLDGIAVRLGVSA